VAPDATADQIRRAYRRLARQHHPDVNAAQDAATRFTSVQQAYSVLSDRQARAAYDQALAAAAAAEQASATKTRTPHYSWRNIATDATPDPSSPAARTDLDDMYDAFFGGPLA
jgi:curved DNA-binding protein